jgi:aldose sugar dehydrogenase
MRPFVMITALVLLGSGVLHGCDRNSTRDDDGPADAVDPSNNTPDDDLCELVEDGFGPTGEANVRAEELVDGLEVPWGLLFVDETTLLVTERPGRLRLVEDGQLVDEPIATLDVNPGGEGGLLGIAAHPDFDSNRLFYLYVTVDVDGQRQNRVELWQLSQDAESLSASRQRVVLDDIPAAAIHDGGRLRIGPDDMLYVGTGDSADADLSQDHQSMGGALLRVTLDGEVPDDNPFGDSPVYVTGIRNTQGFDWPDDDTIWLVDHGPSGEFGRRAHDEINVAQAGTNLGWPTIYGCEEQPDMRPPALVWQDAVPPGGAAIYTGDAIESWQGSLLVGTLGSRHLHRVVFADDGRRVEHHETYFEGEPPDGLGRLREVVMGPDGHLYVTTSNCDGRGRCPDDGDKVLRIVAD